MTRRERRERKAERLRGWAEKRETAAAAVFKAGEVYHGDTAFNTQPGHIPERARVIAREHRAFESLQKAEGMTGRAAGIERQLDRSIYSDDPDALKSLAARIATLEAKRDTMKRANAAFRKGGIDAVRQACGDAAAIAGASNLQHCPWEKSPFPGWELTNMGSNIRRLKERAEQIKRRAEKSEKADEAGGTLIEQGEGWARVTFAEKPERDVLDALRTAGFRWTGGSWIGTPASLPEIVREMAEPPAQQLPEKIATDGSIAVDEVTP